MVAHNGADIFFLKLQAFLCCSCCWIWNHTFSNIFLDEEIRECLYLPSQLLLYASFLGEKEKQRLHTKDFWACHPNFPNRLPECISQLL